MFASQTKNIFIMFNSIKPNNFQVYAKIFLLRYVLTIFLYTVYKILLAISDYMSIESPDKLVLRAIPRTALYSCSILLTQVYNIT